MQVLRTKKIKVPPNAIQHICNDLGVRQTLVYDALRYASNSDTAERIRYEAIQRYGGIEVRETKFKC